MIDDDVMALKWMDKRPVAMLTTVHDDSVITKQRWTRAVHGGVEEVHKPVVVEQYNEFMGGVDTGDQLLSYYGISHCTLKWWRRAFFHLITSHNVSHNTMWRTVADSQGVQDSTGKGAVDGHINCWCGTSQLWTTSETKSSLVRLTGRHFPAKVGSGRQSQPDCIVCSRKKGNGRKSSTYKCKQCDLPMCVVPYFELYHTKSNPEHYL